MNTPTLETWTAEHGVETSAAPETIWRIWTDVPNWPTWNAGLATAVLLGPFVTGSEFVLTPRGQRQLRPALIEVREPDLFVHETRVADLTVAVLHRIETVAPQRWRITCAVHAAGDGADEVGPVVSADFPKVLAALVQRAESCC